MRQRIGGDKKEAEIHLKEIEYRLSINELTPYKRIPVSVVKKEFLEYIQSRKAARTLYNYKIALDRFVEFLTDKFPAAYLQDVSLSMVDEYVSSRRNNNSFIRIGNHVAESTVNTELKAIKRFFNRAVEVGYLKVNPARKAKFLTVPQKAPRFFSGDELRPLFDTCNDAQINQIYVTLFRTGLRIGELVNLEWDDIDLKSSHLNVRVKKFWKPKGNRERQIPLHSSVYSILQNKQRISHWVFSDAKGEQIKIHSLQTNFRRHLKKLGICNASLHTWRHSFASYFIMRTGNMRALQLLLGHGSIKTTEIYAHLSDQHLHDLIGQLPNINLGTNLGTTLILPGQGIVQVADKKVVGDTGFEPVTSTV